MLEKIVNIKNLLSSQLDTLNDLYSRGLLEGSSEKFLSCASGCQHCPVLPREDPATSARIENEMKDTMLSARKLLHPEQNSFSSNLWHSSHP